MLVFLRNGVMVIAVAICAVLGLATSRSANAAIATIDQVPAATLLFPYFEVDLGNVNGTTTLLTVQNASATAILAHMTVWSDQSIAVAAFNIYLTGYDLQSVNMRDILNGDLPQTASAGQDPGDTISPKGVFSQDINFASCGSQDPPPPPQLPPPPGIIPAPAGMTPSDLRLALTGQATQSISSGQCWAFTHGDNHARGYVTMDTVNNCTLRTAGDAGYFGSGGTGDATNQNVMNGSYFVIDPSQNLVTAEMAVPVEASATNALTVTTGSYTFYGRYDGWTAIDNREPLATTWSVQGETDTSSFLVWRDNKTVPTPHTCGTNPNPFPLGQEGFAFFGTDSKALTPGTTPAFAPGIPIGESTQWVPFNAAVFNAPNRKLGFLFANLNTTVATGGGPPSDPAAAQSYIVVNRQNIGALQAGSGHSAVPLDNASAASHFTPSTF